MGNGDVTNARTRLDAHSMNHIRIILFWGLCLLIFSGCPTQPEKKEAKPSVLEKISAEELPPIEDDLDPETLRTAIENSLAYYDKAPEGRTCNLGEAEVNVGTLKASLRRFLELMGEHKLNRESIGESFDVYRRRDDGAGLLVTGYYEPVLDGRTEPDDQFRHPLYWVPPDLVTVELKQFDPARFSEQRIVGRLVENRLVPYYTRAEIDGQSKLRSSGCELLWLNDPIGAFFLHIQGSGAIRLPKGVMQRVGYAGANGRPYSSIGKKLQEMGAITPEAMSLQSIRSYLEEHPEIRDKILWSNESYVFFRPVKDGPVGSLGFPLTPGRSIATDHTVYPKGALALLRTEKPRFDASGQVVEWEPINRWVLNQDTGGAIRGPGRVDLFCGTGETAEQTAGRMKQPGALLVLIEKSHAGR